MGIRVSIEVMHAGDREADSVSMGEEAERLLALRRAGVSVTATCLLTSDVFHTYETTGSVDYRIVHRIAIWARHREIDQLSLRTVASMSIPSLSSSNAACPVDEAAIEQQLVGLLEAWIGPRLRAYRISRGLSASECNPTLLLQERTQVLCTLVTRHPSSGAPIDSSNVASVGLNSRHASDDEIALLARIERAARAPVLVSFGRRLDGPEVMALSNQPMTSHGALTAVRELYEEGVIDGLTAMSLIEPNKIAELRGTVPSLKAVAREVRGLPASPGQTVGRWATPHSVPSREPYVLILAEMTPAEFDIVRQSAGAIGTGGGMVSHLAVVARAMSIPCVVAAQDLEIRGNAVLLRGASIETPWVLVDGMRGIIQFGTEAAVTYEGRFEVARYEDLEWLARLASTIGESTSFREAPTWLQSQIARSIQALKTAIASRGGGADHSRSHRR